MSTLEALAPVLGRAAAAALVLALAVPGLAGEPAGSPPAPPAPSPPALEARPAPALPVQEGEDAARRPVFVGPLTLDQALALGLSHSLDVALGQAGVPLGEARTAEAAAQGRPRLSVAAYGTGGTTDMIWGGVPGVGPDFLARLEPGALNLNAMLMVPVLNGGLFRHRLEAAEQSEKGALARAALALREAARNTRVGYHRVLRGEALLEAARWERQEQQELLRLVQEQFRQGRVARVTVDRAEAEAAAAAWRVAQREADLAEAEALLKVAMGVSVGSRFRYDDSFPPVLPPGTLEEDLATALSDRPDLVAARYAVEARDREVAAALAEFSPQVYGTAMAARVQSDFLRGGPVDGGYQVGLAAAFPLFDGGERDARVDAARASLDTERLRLQRMEQEATAQVVTARARLEAARAGLDLTEAQVRAAREQLRIAHLRFEAGRGIFLEILDAVSALARARSDRAEASAQAGTAYANLLYATGRY